MKIEDWELRRIKPYPNNPRHNDKAVEGVAASIQEFGPQQPIVVDADGVVLVGHTRLKAAQMLGLDTFPVVVADVLTAAQARAYRIADNKVGEAATWNDEMLKVEVEDLKLEAEDFNLELTGFKLEELDKLFAEAGADEPGEGETDPDFVPKPEVDPVSRVGDLWLLGDHRIICGDSTEADPVSRLLSAQPDDPAFGRISPHLMVTDPPYGVEYDPEWRKHAKYADGSPLSTGDDPALGKVQNDAKADWREAWALFPGEVAYVWHAGRLAGTVQQSLEANAFEVRAQIIWAKNNMIIGRGHYHWKHEPCFYAVRKGGTGHWNGDRSQTTVWDIDYVQKAETGHSTQKPAEAMRRPILNNSNRGDAVYEPFSGSGTTIIACEQTGRVCFAVELYPQFVDIAVRRWQKFTGREAILHGDGRTFDALEAERLPAKAAVE